MAKILLVEDEVILNEIISQSLSNHAFEVFTALNGSDAIRLFEEHIPDLLILDVMLPDIDGFKVAERIREKNKLVPIIFLTSRSQAKDVIRGFETGGNDYLKKPFSIEELIIRVKVLLSPGRLLPHAEQGEVYIHQIGQYQFNELKHVLTFENEKRFLTARESELLKILYRNKNNAVEKKTILETIWKEDTYHNSRTLDVFITKLRKHLKNDPSIEIMNIRGIGYKLAIEQK